MAWCAARELMSNPTKDPPLELLLHHSAHLEGIRVDVLVFQGTIHCRRNSGGRSQMCLNASESVLRSAVTPVRHHQHEKSELQRVLPRI